MRTLVTYYAFYVGYTIYVVWRTPFFTFCHFKIWMTPSKSLKSNGEMEKWRILPKYQWRHQSRTWQRSIDLILSLLPDPWYSICFPASSVRQKWWGSVLRTKYVVYKIIKLKRRDFSDTLPTLPPEPEPFDSNLGTSVAYLIIRSSL